MIDLRLFTERTSPLANWKKPDLGEAGLIGPVSIKLRTMA
jgi:hypothetical protein